MAMQSRRMCEWRTRGLAIMSLSCPWARVGAGSPTHKCGTWGKALALRIGFDVRAEHTSCIVPLCGGAKQCLAAKCPCTMNCQCRRREFDRSSKQHHAMFSASAHTMR